MAPVRDRLQRLATACLAVVVVAGVLPSAATAQTMPPADPPSESDEAVTAVAYEPSITGVDDDKLLDLLKGSSQLYELVDRPPATVLSLERRARNDLSRLRAALQSEGYYDAKLGFDVDTEKQPVAVTVRVDPGPLYTLAEFTVDYVGSPPPPAADRPSLESLDIEIGMPAVAPKIKAGETKLLRLLGDRGYPFPKVDKLDATVRHDKRQMYVKLAVDAGARAKFGAVRIGGLTNIDEAYIRRLISWKEGATFDRREIDETRQALIGTELFGRVQITAQPEPDAEGRVPIAIELTERPQRSIGAGLSYSTDIGFAGEVFWEHRNLLGQNERLKLTVTAGEIEQSGKAAFRKPAFLRRDQALLVDGSLSNLETDAFDQKSISSTVALERRFTRAWRGSVGVTASYDDVQDNDGTREFKLLGLPVTGLMDTTDNLLNPTRGQRLDLSGTPYVGTGDRNLAFLRMLVGGSTYYAIDKDKRFILAGRVRVGSIVGEATEALPADKRFYAGGGGSIRGYEFQRVGPLDSEDDPLGGRSLLEMSGELRIRVTEQFGLVPFIDGGTVFEDPYPSFDRTVRWAGGLGFRYFTGFGPLRLDVAFPINGRDDVDDTFEFYISFGQAF